MYVTSRKRATGAGAAGRGTEAHWNMTVTSWILALLTFPFLLVIAIGVGKPYVEAVAFYASPLPALVAGGYILVGMIHFAQGFRTLVEDYVHGEARKLAIIAGAFVAYAAAFAALWAILRLAL